MTIKWPNRKKGKFAAQARKLAPLLGRPHTVVCAVDPALGRGESVAAAAVFKAGALDQGPEFVHTMAARGSVSTDAATVKLLDGAVSLGQHLARIAPHGIILVIEELRGKMVPPHLHWAAGVIIAGIASQVRVLSLVELPIQIWKAHAATDASYEKGDVADAIQIGRALFAYAAHVQRADRTRRTRAATRRRAAARRRVARTHRRCAPRPSYMDAG